MSLICFSEKSELKENFPSRNDTNTDIFQYLLDCSDPQTTSLIIEKYIKREKKELSLEQQSYVADVETLEMSYAYDDEEEEDNFNTEDLYENEVKDEAGEVGLDYNNSQDDDENDEDQIQWNLILVEFIVFRTILYQLAGISNSFNVFKLSFLIFLIKSKINLSSLYLKTVNRLINY